MEKIELQEIIEACEEAESEYLKLYRPLLGYEDQMEFYRGIDDSLEPSLNEIEGNLGFEIPADFLQVYLISNGGKYFGITLYSLTNNTDDEYGLYYNNFNSSLRGQYNIPEDMLIIGETEEDQLILLGIDDEDYYYYCTWDKETKEKDMDYDYLLEVLMYEIDYYTNAFSVDADAEV